MNSFFDFFLQIQVSCGDIFEGAPAADAIVSEMVHLTEKINLYCVHVVHILIVLAGMSNSSLQLCAI